MASVRVGRVVVALACVLSVLFAGLVSGPAAVALVPTAESDMSVRYESDGSLEPFDVDAVAKERAERIAEQADRVVDLDTSDRALLVDSDGERREVEVPEDSQPVPDAPAVSQAVDPPTNLRFLGWDRQPRPGEAAWGVLWDRAADGTPGIAIEIFRASDGVLVSSYVTPPGRVIVGYRTMNVVPGEDYYVCCGHMTVRGTSVLL